MDEAIPHCSLARRWRRGSFLIYRFESDPAKGKANTCWLHSSSLASSLLPLIPLQHFPALLSLLICLRHWTNNSVVFGDDTQHYTPQHKEMPSLLYNCFLSAGQLIVLHHANASRQGIKGLNVGHTNQSTHFGNECWCFSAQTTNYKKKAFQSQVLIGNCQETALALRGAPVWRSNT